MRSFRSPRYFCVFLSMTVAATMCAAHAAAPVPVKEAKVHVLIYHTFLGREKIPTDFSIDQFREQMLILKKNGFTFVSYADVARGRVSGDRNIMISIDDGNQTVYRAYHDVLKPLHIRPLLAIYPNIIGKRKYALTWEQLRELAADGCDIAAHGFFHLHVNDKLYATNRRAFHDEIFKSKRVLEEKLNRKITVFAYPSGEKSEKAEQMIREAGYSYAFTINWGVLRVPLSENSNPYLLPRYMIEKQNWKSVFARLDGKSLKKVNGNGRKTIVRR